MRIRLIFVLALLALVLPAAKKTSATATGENDELAITATLYTGPADIQQMVGSDLDGHFVVADVKVQPKYGKTVNIQRDDFLLRCYDGNDTSRPFAGSQIADQSTLVVGKVMDGDGKKAKPRLSIGGMGGLTGNQTTYDNAPAKVKENHDEKMAELAKTLDAKILPEKKTDQPLTGLLYFAMDKRKLKDFQLTYGAKETRIDLRFK